MSARRRKPPTASSTRSASPQRPFRQHRSTASSSKREILARQGRALTAGEMLFKEGEILQRLGVSVLADALAIFGTDYDAEPELRGGVSKNP